MSRISWMSGPGRRDDRHKRSLTSMNNSLGPYSVVLSLGWIHVTGTRRDVVMRDAFSV